MPARKQSATVDLKLRLKEPLRAQIEKAAKAHGVSMNAEMAARLQRSFDNDDQERTRALMEKIDAYFTHLEEQGYPVTRTVEGDK